jgi:RNA polymerase sigma-70 factor (ECF subfamily)
MQFPIVAWFLDKSTDDRALFARVAAGDRRAFELLYRRESGAVYRYAVAVCGNEAWAADALQEAFLALWNGALRLDPAKGNAAAFLCGIARHHVLALLRDRLHGAQEWEYDEGAEPDLESDPEVRAIQVQSMTALHAALQALHWHQREVVVLVDLQERDYAQACAIVGIPINTLRTRLLRGRRQLQKLLANTASERPKRRKIA